MFFGLQLFLCFLKLLFFLPFFKWFSAVMCGCCGFLLVETGFWASAWREAILVLGVVACPVGCSPGPWDALAVWLFFRMYRGWCYLMWRGNVCGVCRVCKGWIGSRNSIGGLYFAFMGPAGFWLLSFDGTCLECHVPHKAWLFVFLMGHGRVVGLGWLLLLIGMMLYVLACFGHTLVGCVSSPSCCAHSNPPEASALPQVAPT
ncbi:hypothetical protein R6Q59_036347 [Mikania micrantha]